MKTKEQIKKPKEIIKTRFKYYRFDVSNKEELKTYEKLLETELKGRECFKTHWINLTDYNKHNAFINKIKDIHNKGFVELETKFLFNNQWNTTKDFHNLRVFDWDEYQYQNKDIKEGYYLEITKEINDIRNNTLNCGFCGKQYYKTNKTICDSCLDSEHLKEEDIYLLQLKPISFKGNRKKIPEELNKELLKKYYAKQNKAKKRRAKLELKRQYQKIKEIKNEWKKVKENNLKEYNGKKWLLDNGIIELNNLIYYNHRDIFCFGWRNKLTKKEAEKIKRKIAKFPYAVEFETFKTEVEQ